MTTLSIVIPAYNEEKRIAEIIHRVLGIEENLAKVGIMDLEVLVVDDDSKDHTALIARQIEDVQLIQHARHKGYGAALKTGFSVASGELIGFLNADGAYPPEYFPQLCIAAINGGDLVIGSRMVGRDGQMPIRPRAGNFFSAKLLNLIDGQHISDSTSGMRVFRREILKQIYPLPDGRNLTPVMSTRAFYEGIRIREVPIPYNQGIGQPKLSYVLDGLVCLQSIICIVLTYNPVRVLGFVGLGFIAVACVTALGLIIGRVNGITSLGPWGIAALYTALVSGIIGISVFTLGVTFNYLVSMFHKRPVRQGLFGRSVFKLLPNHLFGLWGTLGVLVGLVIGVVSISIGVNRWELAWLCLSLLGSAMFILIGIQLLIYWLLIRVLEELSQREILAQEDLEIA
jgi:glycosyltransferase involved in cell wall biosynthesis